MDVIRAGDINNDGKPDLVFNSSVRLGTGTNTFSAPASVDLGETFQLKELIDYNNDGNLDAIGVAASDLVERLGNGAGVLPNSVTLSSAGGSFKTFRMSTATVFLISLMRIICGTD